MMLIPNLNMSIELILKHPLFSNIHLDPQGNLKAYLSEFLETIPSEITIKSLLFDTEKQVATLVGNADDRSALLLLKNQLEEIDMVQVVTVPLSSLEANTDINFVFTIALVID